MHLFRAPLLVAVAIIVPAHAQDNARQPEQTAQVGAQTSDQGAVSPNVEAAQIELSTSNGETRQSPSSVYLPDGISASRPDNGTAQDDTRVRQASRVEPGSPIDGDSGAASQITREEESERVIAQLSKGDLDATLAQLSPAERQVLLDAIGGTDICENPPEIEAILELCRTRIETRSTEFGARQANTLSAEERLLGERLEDGRPDSFSRAIDRLARNTGDADNLADQAIASVALGRTAPPPNQPNDGNDGSAGDLPLETQSLINAIVQQLGGTGGGN